MLGIHTIHDLSVENRKSEGQDLPNHLEFQFGAAKTQILPGLHGAVDTCKESSNRDSPAIKRLPTTIVQAQVDPQNSTRLL